VNGDYNIGDNTILFTNIRNDIEKMDVNRQQIIKLKSRFHASANTETDKKINEDFEKIISNNTSLTKKIFAAQIGKETSKIDTNGGTSHQKTQLSTVNKQFRETCMNFETTVNEMMNTIRNKNIRQIKILDVDQQLTDKDIDRIVDNPDQARDFIQKEFAMTDVGDQMLDTLAGLEDKYQGMKKIQEDVAALHALFQDLQVIVNEQQEMFDSVEQHVDETKENVQKKVLNI